MTRSSSDPNPQHGLVERGRTFGKSVMLAVVRGSDAPHPSGNDRYAIYTLRPAGKLTHTRQQVRLAETSVDGIGLTLVTLVEEGEFLSDYGSRTPVGIFDRETREWLINPWSGNA